MLGLETTVTIGKQASVANPSTQARITLNVYSIEGGVTQDMPDDPILDGGFQNTSDPTVPGPGLPDHKLTVKFPVCINQIGFWCAALFGTETATGAAPTTHAWKSGAALPYVFIEHKVTTNDYRRHFGCVGESLALDFSSEKEGFAMATATFIGLDEQAASAPLTGTITAAPTLLRPAEALVSVSYGGAAGGAIMGGKVTFTRKLKRTRAADGTGIPVSIDLQSKSTLEGSIHVRYKDQTLNADAIAQTLRDINIALGTDTNDQITWDMPNCRLARTPMSITGPDGIEMDFSFKGWQDATNAAFNTSLKNAAATATI